MHNHIGPPVIWLTGLSGAGKTTIAVGLAARLRDLGEGVSVIDGDALRQGLSSDLGFSDLDRRENMRRATEVAKLMRAAGLRVIVALISPIQRERDNARKILSDGGCIEVYVDAPLSVAESRDPKGLYVRARRGEITNFTGIDSPYEAPERPDIRIDTSSCCPAQAIDQVLSRIR